jgi:hypothetical protein
MLKHLPVSPFSFTFEILLPFVSLLISCAPHEVILGLVNNEFRLSSDLLSFLR